MSYLNFVFGTGNEACVKTTEGIDSKGLGLLFIPVELSAPQNFL